MAKAKPDIYQEVTDRIIAALEEGTVPWRRPWTTRPGEGGPVNIRTRRPYRGINVFLLALEGYNDPRWGTYNAMKAAGGNVRKGEKATRVILWKPVKAKADQEEKRDYLILKSYSVFNAEQCDGLPELESAEDNVEFDPIVRADEIVDGYVGGLGPALRMGGDRAAYSPFKDVIYMPHQVAFDSNESYYGTLFHEMVHSTGHESRLDRIEPALFGSDPYAREELVAEMGASMLSGVAGLSIAGGEQSAAYIAGWLSKLKDDRKLVIGAAAQAQKACDVVTGTTFDEEKTDETPSDAVEAALSV